MKTEDYVTVVRHPSQKWVARIMMLDSRTGDYAVLIQSVPMSRMDAERQAQVWAQAQELEYRP